MVLKSDQERIKALLKDTITLLCRNGLTFKTEFSIEALIGITLDQDDVLLVNINEIVRTELGTKLAAAQASGQHADLGGGDDWNEEDSEDGVPQSPSNSSSSKRRRKRRRSSGQTSKADDFDSDGGGGGSANSITGAEDGSLSEPPIKRSQVGITSRMKNSVKEEREDDEDSKDIVFIKEEMDSGDWASTSQATDNFPSDLSAIPSGSGALQHHQHHDNFDFLQGNSLVPMSGTSQQNANLWSEMTGRQNIMSPASKRTSTVTSNPAGPIGDESQQRTSLPFHLGHGTGISSSVGCSSSGTMKSTHQCHLCDKVLGTLQGLQYHLKLHQGIYRYNCAFCDKGFSSSTTLKGHLNVYHAAEAGQSSMLYKCRYCNKTYPYQQSLHSHIATAHKYISQSEQLRNPLPYNFDFKEDTSRHASGSTIIQPHPSAFKFGEIQGETRMLQITESSRAFVFEDRSRHVSESILIQPPHITSTNTLVREQAENNDSSDSKKCEPEDLRLYIPSEDHEDPALKRFILKRD